MSRRFITLVLAAATAVSLTAREVRAASTEDIAKIAGGVALLLILGTAIDAAQDRDDDKSDKKKKQAKAQKQKPADHGYHDHYGEHHHGKEGRHHAHPHGSPGYGQGHAHLSPRTLPPECRVRLPVSDDRSRGFYPSGCLKRTYPGFATLPAACNVKIKRDGRKIVGFGERCLDKRGYHTPRY